MANAPIRDIQYMDTATAYDLWSQLYDTDGNFLQALDDIEMQRILPTFISQIDLKQPLRVVDLGCGTGRNTAALLQLVEATVIGLDISPKMLDVARARFQDQDGGKSRSSAPTFEVFDMINSNDIPDAARGVHAVISTLVLEHVPIETFFGTAKKMLTTNGLLLVTNMHSDMGKISQAGFVDPLTGVKIRPKSYAHSVEDLMHEASKQGFELLGNVEERSINPDIAVKVGPRAQKWIGVNVWYGGIFRKIC